MLEHCAAHGSAFEDRLDELVLLEGFGEVLVHLVLEAGFAVADHGVGCQGDDGGAGEGVGGFEGADFFRGLEAAFCLLLVIVICWCEVCIDMTY